MRNLIIGIFFLISLSGCGSGFQTVNAPSAPLNLSSANSVIGLFGTGNRDAGTDFERWVCAKWKLRFDGCIGGVWRKRGKQPKRGCHSDSDGML